MLDPRLIAEATELISNPPPRTEAADRVAFARIVADSHRLEGIETSVEQVLEAADASIPKAHAAASKIA